MIGRKWLLVVISIGIALLSGTAAHSQNDPAALYKSKCAGCHAPDGSGNTSIGTKLKMRDLRSPDVQKQTDAELMEIIAMGKSPMPAYKNQLTDAQIRQLVTYIRMLAKNDRRGSN